MRFLSLRIAERSHDFSRGPLGPRESGCFAASRSDARISVVGVRWDPAEEHRGLRGHG